MGRSIRRNRKGRALAVASGFTLSICVFAQEADLKPNSPQAELEQVLQVLERVEAEQRVLRQEIEALRVQSTGLPAQGRDAAEAEDVMDPTSLFEAEEEPPAQGDSLEIERIRAELTRLEAEQQALRQDIEGLWARGSEAPVQDSEDMAPEGGEIPASQDDRESQDVSIPAEEQEETPVPALDPAESELALGEDSAEGDMPIPLEEKPAYSPEPYRPAEKLYEQGREAFRNLNFYDAAKAFHEFLTQYPAHGNAGEARYWLGESLYVEGRFQEAIAAFAEVTADETNPRREVARLKTGYAWFELGEFERAEAILIQVRDQDPDSDLARLAQLRIDRLQRRKVRE